MKRWWLALMCTGLIACAESGDGEDAGEDDLPSPYTGDGGTDEDQPAMAADEAADAAVAGLEAFVLLEPDGVIAAYESLAVFDGECPEQQDTYGEEGNQVTVWSTDGCTTADGTEISGSGRVEETSYDDGNRVSQGGGLSSEGGTFTIVASDGRFLQYQGYMYFERGTSEESTDSYFDFTGTASADEETAQASPLLDGNLAATGGIFSYAQGAFKLIGGSGAVSGPGLGDAKAFQFSDLLLSEFNCSVEPAGTLSVRDDEGFWYDIVFDVAVWDPDSEEQPEFDDDLCDGCGAFLAGGELDGEACVDGAGIEGLMDWEDHPW